MIRIFVLAALILVVPAVARAATIDFLGMGNAEIVAIGGVRTITAWAGEIKWAWLTGNPTGSSDPFYTYCVNLLTDEKDGQTVTLKSTADLPSMATNGAAKAAWLFNSYADIVRGATGDLGEAMGAGLQLAIWEVLYDNTLAAPVNGNLYNIYAGSFFITSASTEAKAAANTYLKALSTANYTGSTAVWLDAPNGGLGSQSLGQDQIMRNVPEPATLLLVGTGLMGLATARRKKARTPATV